MANYFGYMRISTKETEDKQSYNRQEKGLLNYSKQNEFKYHTIFKDDKTGATFEREKWQKLEDILKPEDTIIFKEISRFTREAQEGYNKYMELMEKGINLIFLDNPTVSTDYIKNLTKIADTQNLVTRTALEGTIKLLLIVELDRVEQERKTIVKRIKQGLEASEKQQGRKTGSLDKLTKELETDIKEYSTNRSIRQIDLMKKHNISKNTLRKYIDIIKDRG